MNSQPTCNWYFFASKQYVSQCGAFYGSSELKDLKEAEAEWINCIYCEAKIKIIQLKNFALIPEEL